MSNALQLHSESMSEWQVMRQQAETLVKTGFLPKDIKTPDQALAIVLMGKELGVGMMVSLNNINVIAGKPTISPQLMLALINRTGELEDMRIDDDGQCCAVAMKRKGRTVHSEAFSMKDAALMKTTEGYGDQKKTIPLADKYNWRQMPSVMRKWRAVAACARVVFPDVILGMYTPDEMGAAVEAETGEVVGVLDPPINTGAVVYPSHDLSESKPRGGYHETLPECEPEPVRNVKPEGAQPMQAATTKNGKMIMALIAALKWENDKVRQWIEAEFNYLIETDDFGGFFDVMQSTEQQNVIKALKGAFGGK